MLQGRDLRFDIAFRHDGFQWAPTLGGECYEPCAFVVQTEPAPARFNGHPPLGVNATIPEQEFAEFLAQKLRFQWAPTLGGECYTIVWVGSSRGFSIPCFNGHPPLGVNATY